MTPDERRQDIDAYALGALEPGEQSAIEALLEHDAALRTEFAQAQRVVNALALTPMQVAPPPELRAKIMRRAEQVRPAAAPASRTLGGWRWTWPRLGLVGSYAAALAVILALSLNLAGARRDLTASQNRLAEQQQIVATLRGQGARLIVFDAPGAAVAGETKLLLNSDGRQAYLMSQALPVLPSNQAYQLWQIADNQPVSIGVFTVDQAGIATLAVNAPGATGNFRGVAGITIEPTGGSDQPTSNPILVTNL